MSPLATGVVGVLDLALAIAALRSKFAHRRWSTARLAAFALLWVSAWLALTAGARALNEVIGLPDDPGFVIALIVAVNAAITLLTCVMAAMTREARKINPSSLDEGRAATWVLF